MSKRILSLVLALVMVLGTFGTVFAAEPTGNAKVDWLVEEGLVTGDAGGLRLADGITRAEAAAIVIRSLGLDAEAKAMIGIPSVFKDMGSNWANGYVNVAVGKGFINGYPDGTFKPAANITYAEVASMLVKAKGGLTEAEAKTAVWPTTVIVKAISLGILDGVTVVDFSAVAVREKIFEMIYNVATDEMLGNYTIVKGIVLENYRVENLEKDEVMVEIIREVQKAEYADKSRLEEGDQEIFAIPAKLGDVENLLGKVVDLTLDKNGNVVKVTIDNSYDYITLTSDITVASSKFGKYTVELSERYKGTDERIFRTYYNNEPYAYKAFYDEKNTVEYAKVTVKNGKVLFIDSFGTFEDIAPVAKDIDSKDKVSFYNDSQGFEGEIDTLAVSNKAYIINVVDGKLSVGSNKDIKANDVIHWLYTKTNKEGDLIVFVRPAEDAKVEGEFIDARTPRRAESADVYMKVKDTYYPGYYSKDNRNTVYSFYASEYEFDVLTEEYLDELESFEEEDVIALLDIFGNVQLVATETEILASEYALISDVYGTEFRLLQSDNTKEWFKTGRDTKLTGSNIREERLANYRVNKLVKAYANEDNLLSELKLYDFADAIDATDNVDHRDEIIDNVSYVAKNAVEFNGNEDVFKFINSKTLVFVVGIKDVVGEAVMPVADFVKKYDQADSLDGYAVTNSRDGQLVEAIVITVGATLKASEKGDVVFGKVAYAGKNFIDLQDNDTRYQVSDDLLATLRKGDIVEITLVKGSETKVKAIRNPFELTAKEKETLKVEYIKVDSTAKGGITAANGKKYYVDGAKVFDNYKSGSELTIVVDKYNYVTLLRLSTTAEKASRVEAEGNQVAANAVVTKIVALPKLADLKLADKDAVVAARTDYNALTADQKKLVEEADLDALVAAEAKIIELEVPPTPKFAGTVVIEASNTSSLIFAVTVKNITEDMGIETIKFAVKGSANEIVIPADEVEANAYAYTTEVTEELVAPGTVLVITAYDAEGNIVAQQELTVVAANI